MSVPAGAGSGHPTSPIRDAAYNAMAVASLQYGAGLDALRYVVHLAHDKGLTVADCCNATGFDEAFVSRLIAEVA